MSKKEPPGFRQFRKVKSEIERGISFIMLFDSAMDAMAVFAAFYLLLMLLTLSPLWAFVPAALCLAAGIYRRAGRNKLLMVEEKFEELNEKLRTANDNLGLVNETTQCLDNEIAEEAGDVELGAFFSTRRSLAKIALLVAMCFLIVLLSSLNTKFLDIRLFIEQVRSPPAEIPGMPGVPIEGRSGPPGAGIILSPVSSPDIYGNSTKMAPGNATMSLELNPIGEEVNIRKEGEQYGGEFEEHFPKEVFAQSSEAFGDSIPVEKQEIVKKYFRRIAK
jgi:hypothetical protein